MKGFFVKITFWKCNFGGFANQSLFKSGIENS